MTLDFATTDLLNVAIGRRKMGLPDIVRIRFPSVDAFSLQHVGENRGAVSFWPGAAIACHHSGGCLLAKSSSPCNLCVGLATLGAPPSNSEMVQWYGTFETSDWSRIIGSPFLSLKTPYYLSSTPGMLTAVAPTEVGQTVQPVGYSMSRTELQLNFGQPILL
jgi:hypothetical protein